MESKEIRASLEQELQRTRKEALTRASPEEVSNWDQERKALETELEKVRGELRKLQAKLAEKVLSFQRRQQSHYLWLPEALLRTLSLL